MDNVATSISDRLTQFLITTNKNKSLPGKKQIDIRAYRNYTKDKFLIDLKQINCNNYFKINQNDPHQFHTSPLNYFSKKLTSCLKNSKNIYQNYGLTKGILQSVKVKDKSYKQFCNSTDLMEKNELQHTQIHKFKTYTNSMVKLTCQGKEDYFKSYFENNKKIQKKYGTPSGTS